MDHQDWDQVYVWANNVESNKTEKKGGAGKSKEQKIDEKIEAGNFSHQKMDANYGKKIQKARLEKKMTQKDINKLDKPYLIQKLIYDPSGFFWDFLTPFVLVSLALILN